ncbi:ribokinase [Histoplasma capsulatum G186AR]|uniref:Ribokinase n=1 Tax=Ajellomyces capsulatus TaxID=5037 RepID=A0A8H7ZD34_AJECA|nr:ribokinase [Histoplasma capsulatum]QSS76315.1 ribokinase [Histoplasma capsulatum G186AR]
MRPPLPPQTRHHHYTIINSSRSSRGHRPHINPRRNARRHRQTRQLLPHPPATDPAWRQRPHGPHPPDRGCAHRRRRDHRRQRRRRREPHPLLPRR